MDRVFPSEGKDGSSILLSDAIYLDKLLFHISNICYNNTQKAGDKMKSNILDGKLVAKSIETGVRNKVANYEENYNEHVTLATIIVGNDKASKTYVKMKTKACQRVGIKTMEYCLPEFTTSGLIQLIRMLNEDPEINGILLQHPLPENIDEQKCFDAIAKEKDVDGLSAHNFGKMSFKEEAFGSATPKGIINILDFYNINLEGKKACVVGRSPILGKPMALMLLNKDATVTVCHSKTKNLKEEIKSSDIVIAALGSPEYIKKSWLKEGAILIDAGYNNVNGKSVGDAENPDGIASFYTPVPGGVGPVTIATLLENTITAAEKQKKSIQTKNIKEKQYTKGEIK